MKLGSERAVLRQRRKQLRRELKARLQQARQRMAQLPYVQKLQTRRRRLLALAILVVLVCLSRCRCTPPPSLPSPLPPSQRFPVIKIEVQRHTPKSKDKRATPTTARPRPKYVADSPLEPAWVEAFRLQVAARSQRLAQCFSGAEKPGALRWTAALNPDTGGVSDHKLEALAPSEGLTAAQQACVITALSTPRYQSLAAAHAQSLPDNVSLVLEF